MALKLLPVVIANIPHLQITCLDIYTQQNKLLLGTENQGVVVLDIKEAGEDYYTANVESTNNCETIPDQPITKLNTVEARKELVIVQSGGLVAIYRIEGEQTLSFTPHQIFPKKDIQLYSTSGDSLCLYTSNQFFIYKLNGPGFIQEANIPLDSILVKNCILTETNLYFVQSQSCGIYDRNKRKVSYEIIRWTNIELLGKCGVDQVVLQHDGIVSTILEAKDPKVKLYWSIEPTTIAIMKRHWVGISGTSVEVLSRDSLDVRRVCNFNVYGSLKYITSTSSNTFVATSDSIFRLVSPVHLEPISTTYTSTENSSTFHETPTTTTSTSSTSTTSTVESNSTFLYDVLPNDRISALGLSEQEVNYFGCFDILTVRQLAGLPDDSPVIWLYPKLYEKAKKVMANCAKHTLDERSEEKGDRKHKKQREDIANSTSSEEALDHITEIHKKQNHVQNLGTANPEDPLEVLGMDTSKIVSQHSLPPRTVYTKNVYGYIYLSVGEFANILESREIKSPYVLFQEYMEMEPDLRFEHPWMEIYKKNYEHAKRNLKQDSVSHADVFSWLCWVNSDLIGKLDYSAGARAIVFNLKQLHPAPDATECIQIDLTSLCNTQGVQLYLENKKMVQGEFGLEWEQEWEHATLETMAKRIAISGSGQGCIVLPSGTIAWDFISIDEGYSC